MGISRSFFLAALAFVACAGVGVSCGGAIATEGSDSGTGGSSGSGSGSSSGGTSGGSSGVTSSSSGSGSGGSSGSGSGAGSGGGSGGEGMDGGSPCGATPALHPTQAGTIFCGIVGAGDLDCMVGQECCVGGGLGNDQFAADECATWGTTCTNGGGDAGANEPPIPIECNQISDCNANGHPASACCLQGAKNSSVAACGYPKFSDGSAVVCEGAMGVPTSCAAGEVQVCSGQQDCPTGTTCTATKWKLFQIGVCM